MEYLLDSKYIKVKKRSKSKPQLKSKSPLKWIRKNTNPFSVAYPFVPTIRHKSIKEMDCFEETCKWIPFKHEVRKILRHSLKGRIKGLKGYKIKQSNILDTHLEPEINHIVTEDNDIIFTERIGDIKFEYKQKSCDKVPETPIQIVKSSLADDYNKLSTRQTNTTGLTRSNNYGFYTSSAHIYQRSRGNGSDNNVNIEDLMLRHSEEGFYLDRFNDSSKKAFFIDDMHSK